MIRLECCKPLCHYRFTCGISISAMRIIRQGIPAPNHESKNKAAGTAERDASCAVLHEAGRASLATRPSELLALLTILVGVIVQSYTTESFAPDERCRT